MTENIYITLEQIKAHLNIDPDFTDDDEYLMTLADVAIKAIENHIDHSIEQFCHDGVLEAPLQHAALLLIGTWYMQRESISIGHIVAVPEHCLDYLLMPYIDYLDACRRI